MQIFSSDDWNKTEKFVFKVCYKKVICAQNFPSAFPRLSDITSPNLE